MWGGSQYLIGDDSEDQAQPRSADEIAATVSTDMREGESAGSQAPTPVTPESPAAPGANAPEANALEANATVLKVIDGDTVEVDISGQRFSVRFIGIDTPEKTGGYLPAECGGDAATLRTSELLPPGTAVLLQRDEELRDRYDRLLAYVYRASDGLFVNRYLVLDGYAGTMHFEPNTAHRGVFDSAQTEARAARRGIWENCGGPDQKLDQ